MRSLNRLKMRIVGMLKTSLLDWDGHVVSTIYLPGCNFRCHFCHNKEVVMEPESLREVPLPEVIGFLKDNVDFLDGVVITGGEPTMHPDLPDLINEIRKTGLKVKLDTNGTNPDMLKDLIDAGVIDYVAMDIKAPLGSRYDDVADVTVPMEKVKRSISIIMESGIDYEFRTTVVPVLVSAGDIEAIAAYIGGAKKYALQQFKPRNTIDPNFHVVRPYSKGTVLAMAEAAKQYVKKVIIRGDL